MTDPLPRSHHQLAEENEGGVQALIANGTVKPFFLFHLLIYVGLPLLALLVPRRRGSKYLRPIVFALIVSIAVDAIKSRRTLLGANGYVVGLSLCWWIVWCAALLIFNDPERDFKRIERRAAADVSPHNGLEPVPNGNAAAIGDNAEIFNWNDASNDLGGTACSTVNREELDSPSKQLSEHQETFTWQGYPQPFLHRLNWVMGLLFNMRGPEWNWRVSTLEPLPKAVHVQLNPQHPDESCERKDPKYANAKARLNAAFLTWLKSYLYLDLAKHLMMRDCYFWGVIPAPPPPFPFNHLAGYPVLVHLYRLHVTAFGMIVALSYACSFGPVIFLGLSLAFPRASRTLTSAPLDEPWLYSDVFGPFVEAVLDNGLAGCWGQWWHQLFRFGFTSPARWLLSILPDKLASNRHFRRIVMMLSAFTISGTLHACGSYTQFGDTKPLSGTFLYFFLQAVGIMVQNVFVGFVLPKISPRQFPRWFRRAANFAFAYTWLMALGPLIADDLAKGGVWLTEPVPFSLIRGLGLAGDGQEGWWCWKGPWLRHWSDGSWWQSGTQVL